ncbi:MAG: hypothetical protein ABSF37_12430 [Sedimentisphaerales bacterium]|jgi:hypothetical protein
MPKEVKPLSLRQCDDGKWEVKMKSNNCDWVKCETEEDAKIFSNVPIVRDKLAEAALPDEDLAAVLDGTAIVFGKYNMSDGARYFRAMAKRARGKNRSPIY